MADPGACSECGKPRPWVIRTELREDRSRLRRKECRSCQHRWTVVELYVEDYSELAAARSDEHERLLQRERERAWRAEQALSYERQARMADIRTAVQEIARVALDRRAGLVVERLKVRGEMLRDLATSP